MTDRDQKEKILSLIRKVDAEYQTTWIHSILNVELGIPLIFIMLLYFMVVSFVAENQNNLSSIVPIFVAFIALIFSFFALMDRNRDRVLEERNYNLMLCNYDRQSKFAAIEELWILLLKFLGQKKITQDPLLKALVKMKAKNPDLRLEELFEKQPCLFTEKKISRNSITRLTSVICRAGYLKSELERDVALAIIIWHNICPCLSSGRWYTRSAPYQTLFYGNGENAICSRSKWTDILSHKQPCLLVC